MNKILIIGATGNIGYPLVKLLNDQNKVVAATSSVERSIGKFNDLDNVEVKRFDFLDNTTYESILEGVDKVFFVRPPQLGHPDVEIFPFIDYMMKKNISHVIFVSLLGVESNKRTPHYKIEKYIEELDFNYTFIRPSFFMQNITTTHLEDLVKNHDLFIPAGKSLTSFIDTNDIAQFAFKILSDTDSFKNKKYDITGPEAISYYKVADILTKATNTTYTYSKPSLLKFRRTLLKRGEEKEKVNVMVMLYLITQLGNAKEVTNTYKEITTNDATTFEQFVNNNISIFK